MCLAIPGKILSLTDEDPVTRRGWVDFEGLQKEIHLAFTPEAGPGDYVLVHVGFAISTIDAEEAARVFDVLRELGELEELQAGDP
jgi:hydrogenase expression/formation protein HypC